jgi:hypothetical protein
MMHIDTEMYVPDGQVLCHIRNRNLKAEGGITRCLVKAGVRSVWLIRTKTGLVRKSVVFLTWFVPNFIQIISLGLEAIHTVSHNLLLFVDFLLFAWRMQKTKRNFAWGWICFILPTFMNMMNIQHEHFKCMWDIGFLIFSFCIRTSFVVFLLGDVQFKARFSIYSIVFCRTFPGLRLLDEWNILSALMCKTTNCLTVWSWLSFDKLMVSHPIKKCSSY